MAKMMILSILAKKLSLIETYINKYLSSKFDNKEDQDKQMFDESERE